MRIIVFCPGSWQARYGRILKFERVSKYFCSISFRYNDYFSYHEYMDAINDVCESKLEKIREIFWFYIMQSSIYIKNNKFGSLCFLYSYLMIYYFATKDVTISLYAYLMYLFLGTVSCIFFEYAYFCRNEARKLLKTCREILDKKENANV